MVQAQAPVSALRVHSPLTSFVGRDEDVPLVLKNLRAARRTALPKNRTLRAVVDWSWDLLSAAEQVLARRLAIFPGGATLEADADAALRFVRALGWYWMLRGQPGEPEALAREVLALEPGEHSARMAEARVVCALTAAGESWDIDAVRPALAGAVADLTKWSPDGAPAHPIVAMGEPMLALYDRDPERAFAGFDRYSQSEDPWVRAAAPLLQATFGIMLGRTEGAESECQAALAAFRHSARRGVPPRSSCNWPTSPS